MRPISISLSALIFLLAHSAAAQGDFLRSSDSLGDPRGYCLDIPGFGANIQTDGPISSHSCKYGIPGFWVDELFVHTEENHLRLPEYDLCLGAEALEAGARPTSIGCQSGEQEAWSFTPDGRISPLDAPDLCMTFSAQRTYVNTPENTLPAYSSREVTLEPCQAELGHLQRMSWSDPTDQTTFSANTLQSGMPRSLRQSIAALGDAVDPFGTARAYEGVARRFSLADVTRSEPIRYARADNSLLQVYVGNNRNHPRRAARVLVLVHGGGFTRGGLESLTTVATHFAGLGFVVVNTTYPLAPEHQFPAGAQAVSEAVTWVRDNISEYNGNPEQIFVLGHSAGGNHVANFGLRPGLLRGEVPAVAGIIIGSPAVTLEPDEVAEAERAYFGADTSTWAEKSLLGNVENTSMPVLIMLAENDPSHMWHGAADLFSELVSGHGAKPRLRQMPSHGHISYITSIGTSDRIAEEEILDFISPAGRF